MSKTHHNDDQNDITSSQKQMAAELRQRGCGCKKNGRSFVGTTHELKQSNEAFVPIQSSRENQELAKEVKTKCCRSKAPLKTLGTDCDEIAQSSIKNH